MKIGLWETFPILEGLLKEMAPCFSLPSSLALFSLRTGERYHLLLTDRAHLPPAQADCILIPGRREAPILSSCGQVLTGGMSRADPVTFSSIGEERALLCLQQEIVLCGQSIVPFERPIPFLRRYSLYKNLAAGFALSLAEILFGEE